MLSRIVYNCIGRTALSPVNNGSSQRVVSFLLPVHLARQVQRPQVQPGASRLYATEATAEAISEEATTSTTPGRPRKDGRPKKNAASKTKVKNEGLSKTTAKKSGASKKTAKKPGPEKKTAKKAGSSKKKKKVGRPRKAKAVAKKTTVRAVGRPRRKKTAVPTPDQVKSRKVTELRKVALLKVPKMLPQNAFMAFFVEDFTKDGTPALGQLKTITERYRALSTSEREHYQNIAQANKPLNVKSMNEWIESHTPDRIRLANNARRQLNRIAKEPLSEGSSKKSVRAPVRLLKDPRKVSRPSTAFIVFTKERWASGDFKGQTPTTVSKALGAEWKSVSEGVKQRYVDQYKLDSEKYDKDYSAIFTRHMKKPATNAPA